jgi:hypothetical protein
MIGVGCVAVAACANGLIAGGPDAGMEGGGADGSACPQYNLQTDPNHCGSCTNACMSGMVCSAGQCKMQCDPPTTKCLNSDAGVCFDLSKTLNHCGQCTTACSAADAGALEAGSSGNPDAGIPPPDGGFPPGPFWSPGTPVCQSSMCGVTCPMGMTACSDGICYDLQNFHDRCGACTTACVADTQWCTKGNCCPTGQAFCGTSCIDVLSDPSNCGSCGNVCGSGSPVCSNGACTTAITFTDSFTTGVTPSTQCTDWNTFRGKLTGTYTSITMKGSKDMTGRTCSGAAANTLCQALHNGTTVGATSCGGYTWEIGITCAAMGGSPVELSADGTLCACTSPTGYDVRPCIGNLNWGGINGVTCSAPTQTMTVSCQ